MLATLAIVMMLVMMMLVMLVMMVSAFGTNVLLRKLFHLLINRRPSLHRFKQVSARKLRDRRCDRECVGVMLSHKLKRLSELCLGGLVCVAENYTARVLYLVVKELAEVLHIHLALVCVHYDGKAVELNILSSRFLYRADNVAELTDSRRLDKNSRGLIFLNYLLERFAEIPNERATDTARIHLGDIYSRVLEKSAVNTYLAEFVLDKHHLLTRVRLAYQLIYKRGLSRTEKARNYIYFSHFIFPFRFGLGGKN